MIASPPNGVQRFVHHNLPGDFISTASYRLMPFAWTVCAHRGIGWSKASLQRACACVVVLFHLRFSSHDGRTFVFDRGH